MKTPPTSTSGETKRLLSIDESSTYLGIGRSSLYKLIKVGKLPTVNPTPGRTLLLESDLNNYIDSKRA